MFVILCYYFSSSFHNVPPHPDTVSTGRIVPSEENDTSSSSNEAEVRKPRYKRRNERDMRTAIPPQRLLSKAVPTTTTTRASAPPLLSARPPLSNTSSAVVVAYRASAAALPERIPPHRARGARGWRGGEAAGEDWDEEDDAPEEERVEGWRGCG